MKFVSTCVTSPSVKKKKCLRKKKLKNQNRSVVAAEIAVRLEYLQEAEQNSQHYDVQKNLFLKGEMSSLHVIFRHETLVNIHFSVTQCNTNYLVLLLLSALFFLCLSCYVNIFMFCVCHDLRGLSNVSITVFTPPHPLPLL